ncbi:uncharacterized protein LOC134082466 [Sardina pilchardus]|uniref:uncharacterized protein LOC134082466 n=1 Tax=Sardina pilchardus TaxID=27697 RepID=UPI002E15DF6A
MASTPKAGSPAMEAAVGFILGAVAGCALGATEGPMNQAAAALTSGPHLKVMTDAVGDVGPLGVGTLIGATALSTAVASAVTGVTMASLVALMLLRVRRRRDGSLGVGALVWVTSGLAAVVGATASGATLGAAIEMLARASAAAGLLWGLLALALLTPFLRAALLRLGGAERLCCGILEPSEEDRERERRRQEAAADEQRQRVAVEMEQRITMLEEGAGDGNADATQQQQQQHRVAWETQWRERKEAEREERERTELETEQRSVSERVAKAMAQYVDLLAFSGIPMTVTAAVTTGLGLLGFGDYRFVFMALLALVLVMTFALMRSAKLSFWKFAGCMGLFATFAIAVLTVHAGQEVAGDSARLRAAGREVPPRELLVAAMRQRSSLEAVAAGFFVAKLCQVGLGATVGGPLGRQVDGKVVVGAGGAVAATLGLVRASAGFLGAGGTAGALLGAVGASGVSLGSAAAIAVGWSTWAGTVATTAGMVTGALATGKWDVPNLIQVPVAYMFAMTTPY